MTAIVTDYMARKYTTIGDAFSDDPEKYLRFASYLGAGFDTLEAAGMLDREYFSDYQQDEYRISTTIKFTVNPLAYTAFKNLSNDASFVGGIKEFVDKLLEYAKLWQEAIYQLDIYPPEPYLSKYIHDGWGIPDEYMFKPRANWKPKPALEDVIRWASNDADFPRLHDYVEWTGIDSSVEALNEGVPLEDVLA